MEFLPVITNILLALGAVFLIVLIISFLISKFRKEKGEVITESYPAERYRYFTNSDPDSQNPNSINNYYYVDNNNLDGRSFLTQSRNEQSPIIYQQQIINNTVMEYIEPEAFGNHWIDYEEEAYYENPLRKTSTFNFSAFTELPDIKNGRMTIVNEEPLFKYGWE